MLNMVEIECDVFLISSDECPRVFFLLLLLLPSLVSIAEEEEEEKDNLIGMTMILAIRGERFNKEVNVFLLCVVVVVIVFACLFRLPIQSITPLVDWKMSLHAVTSMIESSSLRSFSFPVARHFLLHLEIGDDHNVNK